MIQRAVAGVVEAWSEAHTEAKERFLTGLIDRLKAAGFARDPVLPRKLPLVWTPPMTRLTYHNNPPEDPR